MRFWRKKKTKRQPTNDLWSAMVFLNPALAAELRRQVEGENRG